MRRVWPVTCGLIVLISLLSACAPQQTFIPDTPAMVDPQGPAAAEVAQLWWIFFILGTIIYVGVIAYFLYLLSRRRQNQVIDYQEKGRGLIVWGGIVMPAIVLVFLFILNVRAMADTITGDDDSLTIELTGRQWWWEVHYTEQQFYTANEIHIPAGQPVELKLRSEDVIHSFWVPQLSGKLDLIPDRVNTLWIQADQPGEFWGACAEFCGVQHAKMQLVVVAHAEDEFDTWLAAQQQPSARPETVDTLRGQEVFLSTTCIECHTVRGTQATGELGPDLTHLASRLTLGAGSVPNTLGNLGGWVADPHSIKPGNFMPPTQNLSSEDFTALLAYLQSLE